MCRPLHALALGAMVVSTAAMAIPEPTGRRDVGYLYQPAPTLMPEVHELKKLQEKLLHLGKRQETSSVNTYTIVNSPDETCGFLSGSPGNAIKCANGEKCSWELAHITRIMCGSAAHVTCYNREQALNTELCNDVCQSNSYYLLWYDPPGLTDAVLILTAAIAAPNVHRHTAQYTPTKMESRTIDVQLQACRGLRACHSPTTAREAEF